MDTWTLQMGFPLVRVRLENRMVKISQQRFELNPYDNRTEEFFHGPEEDHKWYIPLSYVTDENPRGMKIVWINKTDYCKFLSFGPE